MISEVMVKSDKPDGVRRFRGGAVVVRRENGIERRSFDAGSDWAEINQRKKDEELLFHVVTTGPRRDHGAPGQKKCEFTLPSGRLLRVFRDGCAQGHVERATKTPDPGDQIYKLRVSDACWIALHREDIDIQYTLEKIDLTEKPVKSKER